MRSRGLGWGALPGGRRRSCRGEKTFVLFFHSDEHWDARGAGRSAAVAARSRELVDGVVEVTGVRFIWEMSKSSQSSVSWAVPTRLK